MLAAAALAAALSKAPCEWDSPGRDPYMGEVPAAVEHYKDIPPAVRAKLRAKMERRAYDDLVIINRDEIIGDYDLYDPNIRDMHFGSKGRICPVVTRNDWPDTLSEFGLVYCEEQTCILVPTVCRNVARITRYRLPPRRELPPPPLPAENPPNTPLGPLWPPPIELVPSTPSEHPGYPPPMFYWPIGPVPRLVPTPTPTTSIPEPATWMMLGIGLALFRKWR